MAVEIQPLHAFSRAEILPLLNGYQTAETYQVDVTEDDTSVTFRARLTPLAAPYQMDFVNDFREDELRRYLDLLAQGCSLGAYDQDRLVGIAIGEHFAEERAMRIWEFHVHPDYRGQGVGRALMEGAVALARQRQAILLYLETQNRNVPAVRFYRRMGFRLEAMDISAYHFLPGSEDDVQFLMKMRLNG